MNIETREIESLPQLAWHARLCKGSDVVQVEHGSSVEIRENFFYEGAWSGSGGVSDYLNSPFISGTGGGVRDGKACFATSSDRMSPLFSIQKNGILHVSNSPMFVMAAAGEKPNDLYPFYFYDFVRTWRMGLHCHAGSLPLASSHSLQVHFNTILSWEKDGKVRFSGHQSMERPTDYASSHAILLEGIKGLFRNASDSGRKKQLVPLAAMSRGYDSTASAALAAQAGCKEAYSFVNEEYTPPDADSGRENAKVLGMVGREYDRWGYMTLPAVMDEEFAMLGVASSITMASLEENLKGRILIVGYHGDVFWDIDGKLCENLTMPWSRFLSGVGVIEFRLRCGFAFFTPTTVSARCHDDMQRIIASDEMKPWWINKKYNRPFARRIAEEAGLERESFGMKKHSGGSAHHHTGEGFTEQGRTSYFRFLESRDSRANRIKVFYWKARLALCHFLWKCTAPNLKTKKKYAKWRRFIPFLWNVPPKEIAWQYQFTFAWCYSVLRSRYAIPG